MFEVEIISQVINPEIVLATGGFILNLLILPTLLDTDAAVPRTQSVLSAVILLFCFSVPYYWIGFYASAASNLLGVFLWSFVAIYRAPTRTAKPQSQSSKSSSKNPSHAD